MKCGHCGNINDSDAKFCVSCGANLENAAALDQGSNNQAGFQQPVNNVGGSGTLGSEGNGGHAGQQNAQNDYVEKGKQIGSQFLNFSKKALKNPMKYSYEVTLNNKISGFISIILLSFIFPLFSYTLMKKIVGDFGFVDIPFSSTVLKPFVFLLIFLAVLVGIQLVVSKLMNVQLSYFDIATRFGVFLILPSVIILVAILALLLSMNVFGGILFGLALTSFSIAISATLYSVKTNVQGGLDLIYGILLTNIGMAIILLMVGDSIVGNIMEQVEYFFPFY